LDIEGHLQPVSGKSSNQIMVDETVIRINDQQFWLYAAPNPQLNDMLHLRLFLTMTTVLTEIFLKELRQKHDVEHIFREVKRRNPSFLNSFSHVEPSTPEKWLQSFARWHNAPN